jgi:hypothetical protein
MKIKSVLKRNTSAFMLSMSAGLMLAQVCFATTLPVKKINWMPGEEEPANGKPVPSKKKISVKIYPDLIDKAMHVIARKNEGKQIDFFVFDLEGTLMHNYKLKGKDHVKITGLAKGSYVYRVFCGDEETASGNFDIR